MFYSYTDPRDDEIYRVLETNTGDFWMVDNLNYNLQGSLAKEGRNGRYYGGIHLPDVAPPGWKIPSIKDWDSLFKSYGKSLTKLISAGFNIEPTGLLEPYTSENGKLEGAHYNPGSTYYMTSENPKKGFIWDIFSIFLPKIMSDYLPRNPEFSIRIFFNGDRQMTAFSESSNSHFVPVRCFANVMPNGLLEMC